MKLPVNNHLECCYLACIIIGGVDALSSATIDAADIYREPHRIIYESMLSLKDKGAEIDLPTVAAELLNSDKLESVGGHVYLMTLLDMVPTSALIKQYAKQLKEMAQRRAAIVQLKKAAERLAESDEDVSIGLEKIQGDLDNIKRDVQIKPGRIHPSNVYLVDDMIMAYHEHIKNIQENTLTLGIKEVDEIIRGVAPGEVLTIIARAGSFKTALLQNILQNHSKKSDGIATFFSLEMPVPMVFERFQQITNKFTGRQVEYFYHSGDTEIPDAIIKEHLAGVAVIPVKVSLKEMARFAPIIQKKTGKPVSAIGIDYLGLVDSDEKSNIDRISSVATGTKDLAKELNVPVILLSQVSRKGGIGENRITLDMGRGSGEIEEGADFVLGLWQQTVNEQLELICSILKNRKGKKGSDWRLELDPQFMRFSGNAEKYIEAAPPSRSTGLDFY